MEEKHRWGNLKVLIEEKAARNGDKSLMFFEDRVVSYREMHEASNAIAHSLKDLGIKKGDNVLVLLSNCPEFLKVWFALAKLGAVIVPINTAAGPYDLEHVMSNSQSETMIIEDALLEKYLTTKDKARISREIIVRTGFEHIRPELMSLDVLEKGPRHNLDTEIHFTDPLSIIYTSGTTGRPKGVILSHFCYINSCINISRYADLKPGDRLFTTLPLFHVGAQYLVVLPAIIADIDFAIAKRFSASRFWAQVRKYDCNVAHYLGSILRILYLQKKRPEDADNPVKRMIGGGAGKDIWEKFEKRFGVTIMDAYGSTESGTVSTCNRIGKTRVGSIGLPVSHQRIEVVDRYDKILPPFEKGEIVIRPEAPYSMMSAYYRNPEATVIACRNLWFHTGDMGYKDGDGYFYFLGRQAHLIRRRGENISAEEVEEVINAHPAVQECAIIGLPSEVGEEDIKAYILPVEGSDCRPEAIVSWCEERIAYFKIPRYIEVVTGLPKTATNRVERHKLKEMGIGEAWDREKAGFKLKIGP